MLPQMRQVSPCNEYRYKDPGESSEAYTARLAQELEDEILAASADQVCAFIAETIVGAVGHLVFSDIDLSYLSLRADNSLYASCTRVLPGHAQSL